MKKRKIKSYDDGYSRSRVVLKAAAAASALLLCGSLSACGEPEPDEDLMGEEIYLPSVSESDLASEDVLTLDGEERYVPVAGEISGEDDQAKRNAAPSDGE